MNNERIKISIIVPVHNASQYLERCIKTLENQTLKEIEILIIDDNSNDNSLVVANKLQEKYSNIRVLPQKRNLGAGAIRNLGIAEAKGKYILFVDSDDWIESNSCLLLYEIAEKNNLELLIGTYKNRTSNVLFEPFIVNRVPKVEVTDGINFLKNNTTNTAVWAKLWKLDFVKVNDLKNKEGRTYEDLPMVLEGIIKSKRIAKIDFPFYNYFIDNPNAITKKRATEKNLEDRLWLMDYLSKQKIIYDSNPIISRFITKLMVSQIIPALNNIRTYTGNNKRLVQLLLYKIGKYRNELYLDFLKSNNQGILKKILISISPKQYLKTLQLYDKIKTVLN